MIAPLIISFFISALLTPLLIAVAKKYKIYDHAIEDRKKHSGNIARIGGIGLVFSAVVVAVLYLTFSREIIAFFIGLALLFVTGLVDDLKGLRARHKLMVQFVVAVIILAGGIGIVSFANPLSGEIMRLDGWVIDLSLVGIPFTITPIANLVTILWIVLVINAVNLFDGLDGLAVGSSTITLGVLLILALSGFGTANTIILATTFMGASLGFLVFNSFPARIFLGDAGAYSLGLLLAVLPIYTNTKVSAAIIVFGLALIDVFWASLSRIRRKQSPFKADRFHLHYRLHDNGISHRNVVLIIYAQSLALGMVVLFGSFSHAVTLLLVIFIATYLYIRLRQA